MWEESPIIFDDEDEAALKDRFVELCAKYYPGRSEFEIGEYTFKGLKDASSRGAQAGKVWIRDLEVLERIDEYRRNGGPPVVEVQGQPVISKEEYQRELLARARQAGDKESAAFYKQFAEVNGWVIKQIDANVNDSRPLPKITFKRYDDPAEAAA